jgi:hypothetical protein
MGDRARSPPIVVTSSREILRDIADKAGPMKRLIAFGYAGAESVC